jgi:hypothetical protein
LLQQQQGVPLWFKTFLQTLTDPTAAAQVLPVGR